MNDDHAGRQGDPVASSLQAPRWPVVLWSTALIVIGFVLMATYGAHSDAHQERVLSELDPLAQALREYGSHLTRWALNHKIEFSRGIGMMAALLAVLAMLLGGWRALPLLPLAGAVALAALGQTLLLFPEDPLATRYYYAAAGLALLFGVWCPAPSRPATAAPRWWMDGVLVTGLTLLGTALRLYALPELPTSFAGEMSVAMLSSRTLAGIQQFVPGALHGTSIGIVHLLPQLAFFELFGSSVYSLRLTAVAASVLTTLLLYWLLRSMSGRTAAVIGCTLLIAAPEQLWWSRGENVNYAMVSLAGVLSASLGWWLRHRLSLGAAAAMALWMPFTRLFYLAAVTLVAYPWMLVAHALLFNRRAWRRVALILPVLLAGTVLWVLSLSIVNYLVAGGNWRFLNPAQHGELVSRRDVEGRRGGVGDLLRRQADSLQVNLTKVAAAFTYRGGFSQWYARMDDPRNTTWINVGVTATAILSVAYLLGQLHKAPAGLLLGWLLAGLLPAVLSTAPDDRRLGMAFPALYACAGFAVSAWLRVVRDRAGRFASWLWATMAVAGLAAMTLSSLGSHFLLPVGEMPLVQAQRMSKDIFERSDAVYYDGDEGGLMLVLLGHADRFLIRKPCVEGLGPRDWLRAILHQPCSFEGVSYRVTTSPAERTRLRRSYTTPQRVTFLVSIAPHSQPAIELLRQIFPEVAEQSLLTGDFGLSRVAFSIDRSTLDARRRPVLVVGLDARLPDAAAVQLLADANLDLERDPHRKGAQVAIRGGIHIETEGWYRTSLSPDCPGARLSIDGRVVRSDDPLHPQLAGVHDFEIQLEDWRVCELPLRIEMSKAGSDSVRTAATLVSPLVANAAAARAPNAALYDGYADEGLLEGVRGAVIDARAAPGGDLLVLVRDGGRYVVQRFTTQGDERAPRNVPLPEGVIAQGFAVAADGAMLFATDVGIFVWDGSAAETLAWENRTFHAPEVVMLAGGRVLAAVPPHGSIEVFDRRGAVLQRLESFEGGPGKFIEPMSVAMSEAGDLVVGQTDGTMIVFRTPPDRFEPRYVGHFRKDFTLSSVLPRSLTFDGPQRILAGDPEQMRVLVHTPQGTRLMASDPQRDWAAITARIGEVRRFVPTPEYLYVLAAERTLRRFRR